MRDRFASIHPVLESLCLQNSTEFECVIIDDGCDESESVLLARYIAQHKWCNAVRHHHSLGLEECERTLALVARAGWLVLVDRDPLPNDFFAHVTEAIDSGAGSAVGFPLVKREKVLYADAKASSAADVLFVPLQRYHAATATEVCTKLRAMGHTPAIIDASAYSYAPGLRQYLADSSFTIGTFNELATGKVRAKSIVLFNDWDPSIRNLIPRWHKQGVTTIGFVEGIQDFADKDTGRRRNPYSATHIVLLSGEDDRQFFANDPRPTEVVGVPRLRTLLDRVPQEHKDPLVLVNLNFTYGVLTEVAQQWLQEVQRACIELELPMLVTKHPADKTCIENAALAQDNLYDAIAQASVFVSRFSSAIIESLCSGTPVVYHNPHGEKVTKFHQPQGAFTVTRDLTGLKTALEKAVTEKPAHVRERALPFLQHHCNIHRDPSLLSARAIARWLT